MVKIRTQNELVTYLELLFAQLQQYPELMSTVQIQEALEMGEKQAVKKLHTGEIQGHKTPVGFRATKKEVVIYLAMNLLDLTDLENEKEIEL